MSDLIGRIVRYTAVVVARAASPDRAANDRGLCVRIEDTIAWVVWDHSYAPVWEIASELELEAQR